MAVPVLAATGTRLATAARTNSAVPKPTGLVAGELLVVRLYAEATSTVTPPSGWTTVTFSPVPQTSTNVSIQRAYWKIATATEVSASTFTFTHASMTTNAVAKRFTGAVTSGTAVEVLASATSGGTSVTTSPSVTGTTGGPDRLLDLAVTNWNAGTWTTPTGWTANSGTTGEMVVYTKAQAAAGTTGAITVANPTTGRVTSTLLGIIPATVTVAAPVVGAGADAAIVLGQTFTRTATETNSPTSRAWTIVSGPTGAGTTIGTAAALTWTPTAAGTYTLRYTATNSGGSDTDDVVVTVTLAPPVVSVAGAGGDVTPVDGAGATYDVDLVPSTGPTTAFVIPVPTGGGPLRTGDFLLAQVSVDTSNLTLTNRTLPSGWSSLTGQVMASSASTTTVQEELIFHTVTAAEAGTTPTWTYTPNGTTAMEGNVAVARFRDVDPANPWAVADPYYADTTVTTGVIASPSVTTLVDNARLVAGFGIRNGSATLTDVTPGYTVLGNGFSGQGRSVALAYKLAASAGASGTATWNLSTTANPKYAVQTALRPAPSGESINLGQTFTTTATETGTVTSRAWTIVSGPTGAGTTIATTAALSWTPTAAGTYVLRYSATNSGGTGTTDLTVTVVVVPPTVDAGPDATINLGETFTRTGTETGGASTSQNWTLRSGPNSSPGQIGSGPTLTWTPSTAGTYVLRYSASNAGGSSNDDMTVTVAPRIGRVVERWTGTALVAERTDRWTGTALVQVITED